MEHHADRPPGALNRNGGTPISSYTCSLGSVGNRSRVADTGPRSSDPDQGLALSLGVCPLNWGRGTGVLDADGARVDKDVEAARPAKHPPGRTYK